MWLFAAGHVHSQISDCNLKKDTDGIKVYTCKSENDRFKTLKAEFTLKNTSFNELKNFMLAVENYPKWQYNMIHAELTDKISDQEINYISQVNAPWPVEDRELVVNLKVSENASDHQMQIDIHTIESNQPVKPGFIRVPFMNGHWKVTSNQQHLDVEYTMHINPGGIIPAWLVNMAMAEGPLETFGNLKKQLE